MEKQHSKGIRLTQDTYDKLTGLMGPKETYSQVVERILTLFDKMGMLRDVLEGAIAYRKGQAERLKALPTFQEREACKSQNDLK